MVSIDFRLEYGVSKEQIFEMLRSIGYVHVRTKPKAAKKGTKWISAEEYIKVEESGRYHIFVEFSTKSSGTEAYPQIDIHAHYSIGLCYLTQKNYSKALNELKLASDIALKINDKIGLKSIQEMINFIANKIISESKPAS